MLRVIRNHRRAAYGHARTATRSSRSRRCRSTRPTAPISACVDAARRAWDRAIELGQESGFRNAQSTVDCADRHHRPRHGLRHDRHRAGLRARASSKLAGGGYFKIINRAVPEALRTLGYRANEIAEIDGLCRGPRHAQCRRLPSISRRSRPRASRRRSDLAKIEAWTWNAPSTSSSCSTGGLLGEAFLTETLKVPAETMNAPSFELLAHLGFSKKDIEAANEHVCGAMTLEGAPHLKAEHLPVFDCASPCGRKGKRSSRSRATST